jgi:hypothetical protein
MLSKLLLGLLIFAAGWIGFGVILTSIRFNTPGTAILTLGILGIIIIAVLWLWFGNKE